MKKTMNFCGMLLMVSCLAACGSSTKQRSETKETVKLVGNDKDDHGCIGSAGYQWSELLQDCIRPFEKGIQMSSSTDPYSSFAAYLVLNEDSSKVEVFLPKKEERPILEKLVNGVWGAKGEGAFRVTCADGVWTLFKGDAKLYDSGK